MIETYKKLWNLLDQQERRRSIVLFVLFFFLGILETVGVASIMPFMAVVGNPQIIESNTVLNYLYIQVGTPGDQMFLAMLGFAAFIALVTALAFGAFTEWFLNRYSQQCILRLSVRLLRAYYARPYQWFLSHHSADLGRTVLQEVAGLVMQSLMPALRVFSRLLVVFFLLLLVIVADPIIALTTAGALIFLYSLIYLFFRGYLARISAASWIANEERFRIAQEGLGAIKQVKVSGLESVYLDRFLVPGKRLARYQANQASLGTLPRYFMEAFAFGGILFILVFLILTRDEGLGLVLPLVAVYAFAGYRLMPALQSVYHDVSAMRYSGYILHRLYPEFMATDSNSSSNVSPAAHPCDPLPVRRDIVLKDITFSYPDSPTPALNNISVVIPANSCVAFVGATGAGKTTAIDLILGLLSPDQGKLLVDGVEINYNNRRQWQRAIGYVPQEIFLSDDSIAANIAFGEFPDRIDFQAVEAAARTADLHDFVTQELPDGFATKVGERGVRLSGGQRQRIGIARALYRDPSVLVFDEATSALDNVTESTVMSAIRNIGRKKTIIMIAHRLSTVRHCDTIFMMKGGRVVADGNYDELAATSSEFSAMASATYRDAES